MYPTYSDGVTDHPRRCGENQAWVLCSKSFLGSPPQVRGKRRLLYPLEAICRITPAGAGKTNIPESLCRRSWDHPRRCGENKKAKAKKNIIMGSPPQVRGKRWTKPKHRAPFGITPAGAGKTRQRRGCSSAKKDHPRRCGENTPRDTLSTIWSGSPPQVRGKLWWGVRKAYKARITPAGAGKTHIPSIFREIFQDHPRGCGENVLFSFHRLKKLGSPPRMRGKPSLSGITKLYHRITPADAGKTLPRSPQE